MDEPNLLGFGSGKAAVKAKLESLKIEVYFSY